MTELYYLQDKRTHVGNSMMWWETYGHGYVCDIRKAKVWTKEEIDDLWKNGSGGEKYRAWPKAYIDARISHHIDMQHCERDQAEP